MEASWKPASSARSIISAHSSGLRTLWSRTANFLFPTMGIRSCERSSMMISFGAVFFRLTPPNLGAENLGMRFWIESELSVPDETDEPPPVLSLLENPGAPAPSPSPECRRHSFTCFWMCFLLRLIRSDPAMTAGPSTVEGKSFRYPSMFSNDSESMSAWADSSSASMTRTPPSSPRRGTSPRPSPPGRRHMVEGERARVNRQQPLGDEHGDVDALLLEVPRQLR
mmetsp:Transcript_23065/g.52959  ORF Transcript_23065/g.52959 Transcript_23065/m.52959 type:complete len:225 (+) Transcript_23065:1-675(+)